MGFNLKELLKEKYLLFDGAMGTMIQASGMTYDLCPEVLNITDPDGILAIHKAYLDAGSDIITTNTFGANRYKLEEAGLEVSDIVSRAVKIAKDASEQGGYVALDLGPIGKLMKPSGDLTFDAAYEMYKEQVLAGKDADLVIIETMSDIAEVRAAVFAVKENSDLPIVCTMTFQEDGRTLMGTDPESMVNILEGIGVDALGVNCSLGPDQLLPIVQSISEYSSIPVIVQANAGLPVRTETGDTAYDLEPETYLGFAKSFIDAGVEIIGGCCGTSPAFISAIKNEVNGLVPEVRTKKKSRKLSTPTSSFNFDEGFIVIGERINPTGNKRVRAALKAYDIPTVVDEGRKQVEAGAQVLDVNVGLPELDQVQTMIDVVDALSVIDVPLQIDASRVDSIEAGLRAFNGIGIINSVNGEKEILDQVLPLAKKYGAYVIALTMDESGIPLLAEERFAVAEKIVEVGKTYGLSEDRFIVDTLVLTASAQQKEVMETIKAIGLVKSAFDVKTTLGLSNVSYGLPNRKLLNRTFLAFALCYGLDSGIINPLNGELMDTVRASRVIRYEDVGSKEYIDQYADMKQEKKAVVTKKKTIVDMLLEGLKDSLKEEVQGLLNDNSPLDVVNNHLIPALDTVGIKYENSDIFLPQLIKAAETVRIGFDLVKAQITTGSEVSKGKIIMATVKGDVHDIGKNLVKILLENYGYDVIDLGKDVQYEAVLNAIEENDVKLIGLSALMTSTVENMKTTIELVNEKYPDVKIFVGGAVLNQEYADQIGADHYCVDASASVRVAQEFFGA